MVWPWEPKNTAKPPHAQYSLGGFLGQSNKGEFAILLFSATVLLCPPAKFILREWHNLRGKSFCPALSIRRTSRAVRLLLFARVDGISQFWPQQGAGLFAEGRVLRYSPKAKSSATRLRAKELFRSNAQTTKDRAQKTALPIYLHSIAWGLPGCSRKGLLWDAPKKSIQRLIQM